MNIQKKLIALFRVFVEKTLLPQILRVQGDIRQWINFNNLLSNNDKVNILDVQRYVDSLPDLREQSSVKSFDRQFKKIQLPSPLQEQSEPKSGLTFNKSFDRQKQRPFLNSTPPFEADQRYDTRSPYKKTSIGGVKQDETFKVVNIGSPLSNNQNNQIQTLQSLDQILKNLMENQAKIDNLVFSYPQPRNIS